MRRSSGGGGPGAERVATEGKAGHVLSPRMTVLDVVGRFRETEGVFKAYDARAGACICCEALFDTIEDAARRFHLDLDALMDDLHAVIQTSTS